MKNSATNYAHKALFRFLAKINDDEYSTDSFQESGLKLIGLLFAYRRSQYKLHLRWNRDESKQLALITIQELASKKKTDPVLNGIHDALLKMSGNNEAAVERLLQTASDRYDEISVSQRKKSTAQREPNPVLNRVIYHHNAHPNLMPAEIIEKLKNDVGNHGITDFDDELKRFFYNVEGKRYSREKHISIESIRNFISERRKK